MLVGQLVLRARDPHLGAEEADSVPSSCGSATGEDVGQRRTGLGLPTGAIVPENPAHSSSASRMCRPGRPCRNLASRFAFAIVQHSGKPVVLDVGSRETRRNPAFRHCGRQLRGQPETAGPSPWPNQVGPGRTPSHASLTSTGIGRLTRFSPSKLGSVSHRSLCCAARSTGWPTARNRSKDTVEGFSREVARRTAPPLCQLVDTKPIR